MRNNYAFTALKYWFKKCCRPFRFIYISLLSLIVFASGPVLAQGQTAGAGGDTVENLTLNQCIAFALKHQPYIQQSIINQAIVQATNAIDLSAWLPQVNANGSITHYLQLPSSFINSAPQKTGVVNTATIPGVSVTQNIFEPALLYAARAAPLLVTQAQQATDSSKIEVVAGVTQSFYALLLTLEQQGVLKEDTVRLAQSVADAYHQYVGGIVDETDYEEATVTLNTSKSQLKQATENIKTEYSVLKMIMGYQPEKQFNIVFDTAEMIKNIGLDTSEQLDYAKRIEFKQLQTDKKLQQQQTDYYRLAWLPTVSAFFNYNEVFENNSFGNLFSAAYPNSYIGLTLSMPIFTGFARVQSERRSQLIEKQLDWSEVTLRSKIDTEYTSALANYKSNLYSLDLFDQSVSLSKRTYFVVSLQYKQGIVPYLNVITAESNLITSEISYLNTLFQVLSSKISLQKAMGDIPY